MQGSGRRRLAGIMVGLTFILGGCAHNGSETGAPGDPDINIVPTDYKRDILGAMHAYLGDPTGIREAGISDPVLKPVGGIQRYVVCVRFNAKKRGNEYAGVKEIAAVFLVGRFDRFVERTPDKPQERDQEKAPTQCAGVGFVPFPELQKLTR
jgi:hypothetical protein